MPPAKTKKKRPTTGVADKAPVEKSVPAAETSSEPKGLRLEWMDPSTLTANPRNWRKHPPAQVSALAAALDQVGWAGALLYNDQTKRLIDGHARQDLKREPGEKVPVLVGSWTEEQEGLILASLDPLAAMAEADQPVLDALLKTVHVQDPALDAMLAALKTPVVPAITEDEAPIDQAGELQKKWKTSQGQLWEIPSLSVKGKSHRLLCGDSTLEGDVARLMDGAASDLMVTDPPYGVEYDPEWRHEAAAMGLIAFSAKRNGKVANDDRVDWSAAYKLFAGNVAYIWHAGRCASEVQRSIEESDFEVRSQIIWAKDSFSISRGHYHWQHEPCWYAVRKDTVGDWTGDRSQSTLWAINKNDGNDQGTHGTQKPVECMARPIRNHGAKGDIVYDPFFGSGTTGVASEQLARLCYAIEIEPKYIAVALERMAKLGLSPKLSG